MSTTRGASKSSLPTAIGTCTKTVACPDHHIAQVAQALRATLSGFYPLFVLFGLALSFLLVNRFY